MKRALSFAVFIGFFLWLTGALALTYSTQRPIPMGVFIGLAKTVWAIAVSTGILLIAWLLGNAFSRVLPLPSQSPLSITPVLATGTGLGILALITLMLGMVGQAKTGVFQVLFTLGLCASVFTIFKRKSYRWEIALPLSRGWWLVAGLPLFLLALAPPEGFDALLYHLAQPEWLLKYHHLQPWPVYPFWHPGLIEGIFTWSLALHSDRAAQLLGLAYVFGAFYVATYWASQVFGFRTARFALLVLLSMPLLFTVAPTAYTDFPLAFYSISALYLLWQSTKERTFSFRGVLPAAIMTGLAMSIKYTAVSLPLTGVVFLGWPSSTRLWRRRQREILLFIAAAVAVAAPWYLRNWVYMGNPFYPFLFGGRFWDAFRASWLAEPHTGIGASPLRWALLPWDVTLGYRDVTYYHSRIGPLFLALAPFTLVAWFKREKSFSRRMAKRLWGLYVLFSVGLWSVGVASSRALWQARLLLPSLVVLAIPTAYGLHQSRRIHVPAIRIRYILKWVTVLTVMATLLEGWVFTVYRHPLTYILGVESRQAYYQRALPDYADLTSLLHQYTTSRDRIFFLFEPRSYGVRRFTLPDAILDHWAWYLHRDGSPEGVLHELQAEGYTHVLLYRRGMNFMVENKPDEMTPSRALALGGFLQALRPVAVQGHYALYALPSP